MASRLLVFCEANKKTLANAMAAAATGNPADRESTFTVPLSPDGSEPATHYGASALIDDSTRMNLIMMMSQHSDKIFAYYILSHLPPHLLQSPPSHPGLGLKFGWDDALNELGLMQIIPEDDLLP